MSKPSLTQRTKSQLIDRILGRKAGSGGLVIAMPQARKTAHPSIPEAFTRFDRHPGYERMLVPKAVAAWPIRFSACTTASPAQRRASTGAST